MNDITFAASRLAAYRASDMERDARQRRAIAAYTADCVRPPVREHPRVRFPRFRFPQLGGTPTVRPAI
jgi:hypothetical protein